MKYLIATLLGGYLLLLVFVYAVQDALIYFPGDSGLELTPTPANANLYFEDVRLETSDGVILHGWYVPAEGQSRGALLFFHGNAGNVSHRLNSILQFHEQGLSVFIIDYRGYGLSEGSPTEEGTYRDADAAWQYLVGTRGIDPSRIVVFGRSLGGAVAAWIAAKYTPRALILESTFFSALQLAQENYSFLPVRLLSRYRYNTGDYVTDVAGPVLVIHSRDDEIIPFFHGQAVYDAVRGARTFLEISGPHNGGHLVSAVRYTSGLTEFLDGLFGRY